MANNATPVHPRCPFCGEEILPSQRKSKDHVFLDALGGRVTVLSHETCNNQSGSSSEGELQRPNSIINLMKAAKGLGSSPIRGTFPSGRRADLDLTDGSVYSPPSFIKSADGSAIRIEGTPAEAEKAYNKWRARNPAINLPEFKDLPPGSVTPVSYSTVNLDMQYSLKDAEAVALKSALGACTLAYGPDFPASDFAAAMRAVQSDPFDPQRQVMDRSALSILDMSIRTIAVQFGFSEVAASELPRLSPSTGESSHDVILIPNGRKTIVFAHYASELIPPYGITIDASLPPLAPGIDPKMPILLRDGGTGDNLQVTDYTQILLQPAIDAAIATRNELETQATEERTSGSS